MDSWLPSKSYLILLFLIHGLKGLNISTTPATSKNASQTTLQPLQPLKNTHALNNQTDVKFTDSNIGNISRYVIAVGDSIQFDCGVNGPPTAVVKWQKYGKPLEEVCYRFEGFVHYRSFQLQLQYALLPDSGNYTCIVMSGNVTLERSFILKVQEKTEPTKPKIKEFSPQNLTIIAGKSVRMHCIAEGPFNDTLPFIKLGKYTKISTGSNTTKGLNVTEKLDMEISRMKKRESIGRYMCKNYEIIKDGDAVSILETIKLERSVLVEHVLDHIRMDDDAEYSCVAFNDVGFSKETLYLHVTPPPAPSIYELALAYASKFGDNDAQYKIPLSVSVGLPVTLIVVLTIGFIWWRENVKQKSHEERLSLIKIKKLRELDNFSSLEHMEKFSSRMETKRSSFVSDGIASAAIDSHYHNDDDSHDQEHDRLLGNGHPTSLSIECDRKNGSPRAPEMIPLHDMATTTSETPVTGRSSAFDSHSELEWEPVDLKLNIPIKSEFAQILDTSA